MNPKTLLLAAAVCCGFATTAFAQTPPAGAASTPRLDQRQANQAARIEQGTGSGALTPREQRRLQREQNAIAKTETAAKADGVVTRRERAHMQHMQNRASRDIARQKHDRQGAASAP